MCRDEKLKLVAEFIQSHRFHSGLDFSSELGYETCKCLAIGILDLLERK